MKPKIDMKEGKKCDARGGRMKKKQTRLEEVE